MPSTNGIARGVAREKYERISEFVRCPACHDQLRAEGDMASIHRLACVQCASSYPCREGVLDFSMTVADELTQQGFSYQWQRRSEGAFEKGTIYGRSIAGRAKDVADMFEAGTAPSMILDAGCGAGDIAIDLARRFPTATIIAVDYSTSAFDIAARRDLPVNVVVMRGDIRRLPLSDSSIDVAYSLGVMHHTDNTRISFDAVARVVRADGRMVLWLYPDAQEVPFYKLYYRIRDRHFAGLGHRLPNRLRAWLVYAYTWLMLPYLRLGKYRHFFAEDPGAVTLRQFAGSAALIIFDDVTPRYQFRHEEAEVLAWYRELGFMRGHLDKAKWLYVGVKT